MAVDGNDLTLGILAQVFGGLGEARLALAGEYRLVEFEQHVGVLARVHRAVYQGQKRAEKYGGSRAARAL
ncbi:hypothetical protein GCM10028793_42530 [Nocardiopsis oceani]